MTGKTFFLTGAQRSGTTLLEKLLGMHGSISVLSQPFPLLYVDAKRSFLSSIGSVDEPYPLGHLFHESRYRPERFHEFLRASRPDSSALSTIFRSMEGYSGQYRRFTSSQVATAIAALDCDGDFATTVETLTQVLAGKEARWYGTKETSTEEFVPFLLERGMRCAIIIRDPRDVVTSLNYGRGDEFGGVRKPMLFNIRSWRKSVAIALAMKGRAHFQACRYEELVARPDQTLDELARTLGIDLRNRRAFREGVRDEEGREWQGNSSHGPRHGISQESVGRYRELLPKETADFIEAATLPELRLLGYETSMTLRNALEVIAAWREPVPSVRPGLESDETSDVNAALEMQRLERVTDPPDHRSREWFLSTEAHARLREALLT